MLKRRNIMADKDTGRVMNPKTLGDDELQDLFEKSFADQVGSYNRIEEFDVKCSKEVAANSVRMDVTIQGMAGCPTAEDFKKGKVEKAEKVTISRADKGSLSFKLVPALTVYLNSTEYIVTYQSV